MVKLQKMTFKRGERIRIWQELKKKKEDINYNY